MLLTDEVGLVLFRIYSVMSLKDFEIISHVCDHHICDQVVKIKKVLA